MAHLSFTLMDYRWVDTKELKMNKRQKIKLLRNDPYSFFDIYGKDQAMSLASWCLLNRGASGERLFNRIEMIAFFTDDCWKYPYLSLPTYIELQKSKARELAT